jgi:hypothetical protein
VTLLGSLAKTLRSKNAGAFALTLDVLFRDQAGYVRASQSPNLTADQIALRYGVAADQVRLEFYPQALALKVTMPRSVPSGDPADSDVYGAQQHVPLMLLDLDCPTTSP